MQTLLAAATAAAAYVWLAIRYLLSFVFMYGCALMAVFVCVCVCVRAQYRVMPIRHQANERATKTTTIIITKAQAGRPTSSSSFGYNHILHIYTRINIYERRVCSCYTRKYILYIHIWLYKCIAL